MKSSTKAFLCCAIIIWLITWILILFCGNLYFSSWVIYCGFAIEHLSVTPENKIIWEVFFSNIYLIHDKAGERFFWFYSLALKFKTFKFNFGTSGKKVEIDANRKVFSDELKNFFFCFIFIEFFFLLLFFLHSLKNW